MRLNLSLGIGASRPTFDPLSLFAASEPGVWYDPSDLATMFQDTAGTVPVTAVGQSVARINDKSGRGFHATQSTLANQPTLQQDGGGRYFLLFDGNDRLVTSTITPGTDKAQVFAGVRKLSDAAQAAIASTGSVGLANRLEMYAPVGAAANYGVAVSGSTTLVSADSANTFAAPITSVVTGIYDVSLASGEAVLRIDGTQRAVSSGSAGTGNFSAQPLSVGSRGTELYLNGRLYGLIVRFGANLDAGTIAQVENWMNARTGAY